jgi:hypothetical protein
MPPLTCSMYSARLRPGWRIEVKLSRTDTVSFRRRRTTSRSGGARASASTSCPLGSVKRSDCGRGRGEVQAGRGEGEGALRRSERGDQKDREMAAQAMRRCPQGSL